MTQSESLPRQGGVVECGGDFSDSKNHFEVCRARGDIFKTSHL